MIGRNTKIKSKIILANTIVSNKCFLLFFSIIFLNLSGYAQDLKKTTGMAKVRIESYMTKDEAYEKAEELAMIDAIEKIFGTYVEQQTDIIIESGRTNYHIIGTTKVKGEWIRTIDKEFREEIQVVDGDYGKQNITWVYCEIKGIVKKLIPKADIHFLTLNCPATECRTNSYYSGEQLYLYFKSPINGYLSVFLDDGKKIYRLLPYNTMNADNLNAVFIEADKIYILFSMSKEHDYFPGFHVDELELFTYSYQEYNYLYLVFAEEPFVKPLLNKSVELPEYKDNFKLPKSLSKREFQEWISDNRAIMDSFQDIKIKISIESN